MSAVAGRPTRASWLKALHRWHWISSAVALAGLLLFAATGLTLNHAAQIEAHPVVVGRKAILPPALLAAQAPRPGDAGRHGPLPAGIADWVAGALRVDVRGRPAEWSPDELYVALPRPGGDAWVRIDRASGQAELEDTDRGWISYANDLHKGRNAGPAWRWFIDAFALACLVFAVTGLVLLKMHAGGRPGTWPLVGLGVVLPVLLALLFVH
ncbi:MAG: PepSY-associated TM helix domain-containing protein [Burkholderiales bacterium]|nr:PepSY-associated TM helix domain-containing protein [Burkholderiales bacterium]